MFACLFGRSPHLAALAAQFSPLVETVDPDTIVFSIAGLGRLFGDTNQIVSEISRRGEEMRIVANLAIAANPAAAILAARHLRGVTTCSSAGYLHRHNGFADRLKLRQRHNGATQLQR